MIRKPKHTEETLREQRDNAYLALIHATFRTHDGGALCDGCKEAYARVARMLSPSHMQSVEPTT